MTNKKGVTDSIRCAARVREVRVVLASIFSQPLHASMVYSQYGNVRSFLVTPSLIAVLLSASDPACVPKTIALRPANLTRKLIFSYLGTGSITTCMLFSMFP